VQGNVNGDRSRPRRSGGPAPDYMPFEVPQVGCTAGTVSIVKLFTSLPSGSDSPVPGKDLSDGGR
jgi:hypothetical protein